MRSCQEPFGVGGACSNDMHCKGALKCTVDDVYGDKVGTGTCYNPKLTTLRRGQKCNPKAMGSMKQCETDLQCLKKKSGSFACQSSASVGEPCDDGENVKCTDGSKCAWYNLCV